MAKFVIANNLTITTSDFENICRTCLSRDSLKPLYGNYLAEMLMSCTVVKVAENDGLPSKICTNCINEINKAFSFAKRCETTETFLRTCVIKIEEEIKPAIISRTVKEVLDDYELMEKVKQEEDVKMEFEENVTEVEEGMKIEIEYDELYSDPVDESIKVEVDDEVEDETYSDNPGFRNRQRFTNLETKKKSIGCKTYVDPESYEENDKQDETYSAKPVNFVSGHKATNSQINDDEDIEKFDNSQLEKYTSKDDDSESYDDSTDESYEQDYNEDQDEMYSEKPDNSGSRLRCKTTLPQIKEGSAKNKMSQYKDVQPSKSSNRNSQNEEKSLKDDDRENYEGDNQDETYSEKSDHSNSRHKPINSQIIDDDDGIETSNNSGSRLKRRCTISQIEEKSLKDYDCESYDDSADESIEEEDDDDEDEDYTYSGKPDNTRSSLKRTTTNHQIKVESTKNKLGQHKHDRHFKSRVNQCQKGLLTGEKPYTCTVCSKAFLHPSVLQRHMSVHTGEKPYTCNVCSKAFSRAENLQRHRRIHTGEKPYTCDVCSAAFSQNSTLGRHMRVHTGEKPYICRVCSKAFSESSTLRKHMRVHTGEKPYTCKICSKAFSRAEILQRHRSVHTGEKPYMCKVCSKVFSRAANLQRHMSVHTGEKPYMCKVCSKVFSRAANLQRHMRIHTE